MPTGPRVCRAPPNERECHDLFVRNVRQACLAFPAPCAAVELTKTTIRSQRRSGIIGRLIAKRPFNPEGSSFQTSLAGFLRGDSGAAIWLLQRVDPDARKRAHNTTRHTVALRIMDASKVTAKVIVSTTNDNPQKTCSLGGASGRTVLTDAQVQDGLHVTIWGTRGY